MVASFPLPFQTCSLVIVLSASAATAGGGGGGGGAGLLALDISDCVESKFSLKLRRV